MPEPVVIESKTRYGHRSLRLHQGDPSPGLLNPPCEHGCWWELTEVEDPGTQFEMTYRFEVTLPCPHHGEIFGDLLTVDLGNGTRWLPEGGKSFLAHRHPYDGDALWSTKSLWFDTPDLAELAEAIGRDDEAGAMNLAELRIWQSIRWVVLYVWAYERIVEVERRVTYPAKSRTWRAMQEVRSDAAKEIHEFLAVTSEQSQHLLDELADWAMQRDIKAPTNRNQDVYDYWVELSSRSETLTAGGGAPAHGVSELLGW